MTNTMKTTVQKMKSLLTETLCSTGETESHLFFLSLYFPTVRRNMEIYSSIHLPIINTYYAFIMSKFLCSVPDMNDELNGWTLSLPSSSLWSDVQKRHQMLMK